MTRRMWGLVWHRRSIVYYQHRADRFQKLVNDPCPCWVCKRYRKWMYQ